MRSRLFFWSARATCIAAFSFATLFAADVPITSVNDSGNGSLRTGLSNAVSGDRLTFDTLTNGSTLINGNSLLFGQSVTLLNTSPNAITLSDAHAYLLSAPLTIDWGGTLNLSGTLTDGNAGTGQIVKIGVGTVALSGTNTFSNGTVFQGGTLQLLSSGALGSGSLNVNNLSSNTILDLSNGVIVNNNVALMAGLIVHAASGTTSTIGGVISESGGSFGLNQTGTGTLILSGANTFSGGVYVSNDSTIRAQNNTALGSGTVTVAGGLTLDLATGISVSNPFSLSNNFIANVTTGTATIGGVISETASSHLTKTGAGTLILGGSNTYTGATSIQMGELQVRGTLSSDVQISNSQGTLSGAGTVGNVTNDGHVQPGNSGIGNLAVNGNFTQHANGTTDIKINSGGNTPSVNNDHLNVSGQANLGGTLNVLAVGGGTFNTGTSYTILNATGGVSGQYAQVTSTFSMFGVNVTYDANDVIIQFQQTSSLHGIAITANQLSVGNALDNVALSSQGGLFGMINTLGAQSAGQQQTALNQLGGEQFAQTQTIALLTGDQFQQRVTSRLINNGQFLIGSSTHASTDGEARGQFPGDSTNGANGWVQGYGVGGHVNGDGNGAGVRYSQGGALYGVDIGGDDSGVIGVTGGNSYGSFHDGVGSTGQLTSYQVGLYALKHNERAYILGSANYAFDDFGSNRNITTGGLGQVLRGNYFGNQMGANLETGLKLDARWVQVQPLVGLQYLYFMQQGFGETGGPAALNVSASEANSLRTTLGARMIVHQVSGPRGSLWTPYTQWRWVSELLDNDRIINASFNGAPIGGNFVTHGTGIGQNYAIITKGLQVQLADQWSMFGSADVTLGGRLKTETITVGTVYTW